MLTRSHFGSRRNVLAQTSQQRLRAQPVSAAPTFKVVRPAVAFEEAPGESEPLGESVSGLKRSLLSLL